MAGLNDKVSEILKGFERVYLPKEKINQIKERIRTEMRDSYYEYKGLERESEEGAKKIYITC